MSRLRETSLASLDNNRKHVMNEINNLLRLSYLNLMDSFQSNANGIKSLEHIDDTKMNRNVKTLALNPIWYKLVDQAKTHMLEESIKKL